MASLAPLTFTVTDLLFILLNDLFNLSAWSTALFSVPPVVAVRLTLLFLFIDLSLSSMFFNLANVSPALRLIFRLLFFDNLLGTNLYRKFNINQKVF